MSVNSVNTATAQTISSTSTKTTSNTTLDVSDFLQLMVAEMQYQDPLEPMDNSQYIAQMATFSQVEATKEMLSSMHTQSASNLVGKIVEMKTNLNSEGYITGKVDFWTNIDGKVCLSINGSLYDVNDLNTVIDDDYYKQYLDFINGSGGSSNSGSNTGNTTESENGNTTESDT